MANELQIIQGLRSVGDVIVDALVDEFIAQGHSNTGSLVESIAYSVKTFADGYQLDISFNKYGVYQDKGIAAAKVPFTSGSGAKRSRFIQALMKWATERGMVTSQKQAKSMAFAIAAKMKKEGMPTRGSYAYSHNGRRTGFFSDNEVFDQVPELVDKFISEQVFVILEDQINDIQRVISQSKTKAA